MRFCQEALKKQNIVEATMVVSWPDPDHSSNLLPMFFFVVVVVVVVFSVPISRTATLAMKVQQPLGFRYVKTVCNKETKDAVTQLATGRCFL